MHKPKHMTRKTWQEHGSVCGGISFVEYRSKKEISEWCGEPLATVSKILTIMIKQGMIKKYKNNFKYKNPVDY